MPTFGFSAYLRLISLSPKRQRYEIKSRLSPSEGGYDFHRSLKLRAHHFLVDEIPLVDVISSTEAIGRAQEKKSAKEGLIRLGNWREENTGNILAYQPALYESPSGIFKVNYTPNFGIETPEGGTAVHIWNTGTPDLAPRSVYAALSLFPDIYDDHENIPNHLALLSLRNSQLYCLSEASDHSAIGLNLVGNLEEVFRDVREELGLPKHGGKDYPTRPAP